MTHTLAEYLQTAAPVSFIKYPLSYMVKSPIFAAAVGTLILFSGADSSDALTYTDSASTTDILESLVLSALETVVFARIFLKELLAERNEILAKNIVSGLVFNESNWHNTNTSDFFLCFTA